VGLLSGPAHWLLSSSFIKIKGFDEASSMSIDISLFCFIKIYYKSIS
jgi:hypothetical protein